MESSPREEDNKPSLLLKAKFHRLLKEIGIYLFPYLVGLGVRPKASDLLGNHSITEPQPHPRCRICV